MPCKINILHPRAAVGEALRLCLVNSNYEDTAVFQHPADLTAVDKHHIHLIDTTLALSFLNNHTGDFSFSLLVTSDSDPNIIEALYAGAASFINIAKGPEHFVNSVERMVENRADESSELIRNFLMEKSSAQISSDKEDYHLTNKEWQILKMMREGKHLKLIAQQTNTTYETVRTHIKRIYKKLGVMSASEAVIKAMKMKF